MNHLSMGLGRGGLWLFVVALGFAALPASAQIGAEGAAPPRPVVSVVSPELAIPANGSVLIHSIEGRPTVQVTAEGSSTTLTGTLRNVSPDTPSHWAWTPAAPFEPGRYVVTMLVDIGEQRTDTIEVSEAIELDRMPTPLQPRVERVVNRFARSEVPRCVIWDGQRLHADYSSDLSSVEDAFVQLVGGVGPDVAPQLVHQYFYSTSDIAFSSDVNLWTTSQPFYEQSERYCVSYRALRIGTGDEQATELCAEHGDLPPLVGHEVEVPDSKLQRTVCEGPPAGLEQRWCTLNRGCDALSDPAEIEVSHCGLYGAVCRNECLPGGISIGSIMLPAGGGASITISPWGGAGASGTPSAAPCVDVTPERDEEVDAEIRADSAHEEDQGESAAPLRERKRSAGCGCSLVSPSHGARTLLVLPAWILVISRMRRRERRRAL